MNTDMTVEDFLKKWGLLGPVVAFGRRYDTAREKLENYDPLTFVDRIVYHTGKSIEDKYYDSSYNHRNDPSWTGEHEFAKAGLGYLEDLCALAIYKKENGKRPNMLERAAYGLVKKGYLAEKKTDAGNVLTASEKIAYKIGKYLDRKADESNWESRFCDELIEESNKWDKEFDEMGILPVISSKINPSKIEKYNTDILDKKFSSGYPDQPSLFPNSGGLPPKEKPVYYDLDENPVDVDLSKYMKEDRRPWPEKYMTV